jgi:hypothetical protein
MRTAPLLPLLLLPLTAGAAEKRVTTVAELQAALAAARAGDIILLEDGEYRVNANLDCRAEGTQAQPITVRARNRLAAVMRFNALEGFRVSGAYWTFEGLSVDGVCGRDADCEHAFHVTGHAVGFVLRDSRVRDFNAQLKVNATRSASGVWEMPHRGLIERSEFYDSRPRTTPTPVTKLNIDTGDDWVVRDNFLHDFGKQGGVAYGAFMKSGGKRGIFERNRVTCGGLSSGDTRIGLSFGGGGTDPAFCAPAFDSSVPCTPEHTDGVLRNNVVTGCTDVAVYLNKATNTRVLHNTFIATTGVDYRYPASTGEASGNVLSGVIRTREGASFTAGTNRTGVDLATWEAWYVSPISGNLTLKGDVSSLVGAAPRSALVTDDACARARPASGGYTLGALEHSLGDCAQGAGSDGGIGPTDAGTGTTDAGTGTTDAGIVSDGGVGPEKEQPADDSGCAASPGLLPALAALLLPVALRRRARR